MHTTRVVPAKSIAPRAGIFGLPKLVVYASIGGLVLAGTLATVFAVVTTDNPGACRQRAVIGTEIDGVCSDGPDR